MRKKRERKKKREKRKGRKEREKANEGGGCPLFVVTVFGGFFFLVGK